VAHSKVTDALAGPVQQFVDDISAALGRLAAHVPGVRATALPADATNEAFSIAAAFIDADGNHTDDELWALIAAFAGRVETSLPAARPDDVRRAGLVVGKRAWIEQPSQLFGILIGADARFGSHDAQRYYDDAMRIAHTVCSLDEYPSQSELDAVERFRRTLLGAMATTPSAAAADAAVGERAPAEQDAEPLPQLLAELDRLVGLAEVKAEVKLVANLITVQNLRRQRHLPVPEQSRHLVFTGNPGTGKTTVARLLARIYRSLGVVDKGHLVETDRAGLVAGYVGQTAARVTDVFTKALGGVLLIDEAYALARGEEHDFGQEAIDTLVKLIEDHRDDVVVIAAGYPAEMAELIDSNPGLESRFPKTIHFADYSDDELVAIFRSLCDQNAYTVSEGALAHVRAWFGAQTRDKGFGNARLARNLFESAVARQASRVVAISQPTDQQLCSLTAEDVA
jgi:Holliday junction resolvasome RuvABC ATP-dependent DNA helicase subunit